jgi:hypothetical protein
MVGTIDQRRGVDRTDWSAERLLVDSRSDKQLVDVSVSRRLDADTSRSLGHYSVTGNALPTESP